MFDRLVPILKGACVLLALLLVYQVSRISFRKDPLSDLNISPLVLPASARPAKSTNSPPAPETKRQPEFSAAIQARIDRITASEMFGAIPRPMPMALLGIAGKDVFLRAPNGQTGLIRQGEELGGVKLLRIGMNRVLIEQDGQQKELMLFSGFGGEPLLPKGEKSPRELTIQP